MSQPYRLPFPIAVPKGHEGLENIHRVNSQHNGTLPKYDGTASGEETT